MYLSDAFLIQNYFKQGNALLPLHFIFTLEYNIMCVQDSFKGLELNETCSFCHFVGF
jgi:hypothetical protein